MSKRIQCLSVAILRKKAEKKEQQTEDLVSYSAEKEEEKLHTGHIMKNATKTELCLALFPLRQIPPPLPATHGAFPQSSSGNDLSS